MYKVTDPKYTEPGYTTFKDINVKLAGIGQKLSSSSHLKMEPHLNLLKSPMIKLLLFLLPNHHKGLKSKRHHLMPFIQFKA